MSEHTGSAEHHAAAAMAFLISGPKLIAFPCLTSPLKDPSESPDDVYIRMPFILVSLKKLIEKVKQHPLFLAVYLPKANNFQKIRASSYLCRLNPYVIQKLVLLFLLFPSLASAQLVNIETRRIQTDSVRFVLNADFAFDHSNNDGVTVNQINGTLTTQLKSKDLKKIYLFLGNYKLIDADKGNLQNSWFLHTRFNYKLNELLRLEAFVQGQYNELLVVEQRNLIAAGIRIKWVNKENFTGYLGNSYMYEMEHSNKAGTTAYNHRNSTYLSLSYFPKNERFSIANTVYYQPLYRDFGDYRILEQFRLDIPLYEWFKVFVLYDYYFDSKTPLNTTEYTSQLKIGIGVSF